MHVLSSHAYGFTADGLNACNIGRLSDSADQQPLLQTLQTLAATSATGASSRMLRVLHRMLYWKQAEGRCQVTRPTAARASSSARAAHCQPPHPTRAASDYCSPSARRPSLPDALTPDPSTADSPHCTLPTLRLPSPGTRDGREAGRDCGRRGPTPQPLQHTGHCARMSTCCQ
eukprot:6374557-Prymnesium_polylepis.1